MTGAAVALNIFDNKYRASGGIITLLSAVLAIIAAAVLFFAGAGLRELAALLPAILLVCELRLPAIYSDSYYAALPALYSRLSQCEGKKLVIIGGSNVAFGVDTALLEEILAAKGFDYTVCPFGFYAAVGTSAMLDLAQPHINKGDIVVLSFEPYDESVSEYFGATAFLKCAEEAPGLVFGLDKSRRASAAGNYPAFLQERYSIVKSGSYPKAEEVYAKASFDECGNMVYFREYNMMKLGFDSSKPIDLAGLRIEDAFMQQVSEFCSSAEKRGASVYYSFCPMNSSAIADSSPDVISAYFDLCRSFPCRVISDPNRYLLDSCWFYDSNVHLNTAGAQLRTIRLAEDLLAQLGCFEPVNAPLPEAPRVPAESLTDSAGVENFILELSENGSYYTLTGISETGLGLSELALPSAYNSKPIAAIASGALDSAQHLTELRIPGSIEFIPDYLFANCAALERLVLEHTGSPCKISAHSLDGAENAKIFVPASAYTYYRDGFGCERNLCESHIGRIFGY